MTDRRTGARRRPIAVWAGAALILLLVGGAFYVYGLSRSRAFAPPEGTAAPSATGEATQPASPSPTPSLLAPATIASIEAALGSGDDESLRQFLPLAAGEHVHRDFSGTIADMELVIDPQTQRVMGEGVWELAAMDVDGDRWVLGLVSADGSPRLIYAERASE